MPIGITDEQIDPRTRNAGRVRESADIICFTDDDEKQTVTGKERLVG